MPADQFPKFPVFPGDGALAWLRFARAYAEMSTAAAEVIMHRTMKMAQGSMAAPEMLGMVLEKATAFAEASEKAAVAAASGGDPARIASAALRPYSRKTRSNVRKYRG